MGCFRRVISFIWWNAEFILFSSLKNLPHGYQLVAALHFQLLQEKNFCRSLTGQRILKYALLTDKWHNLLLSCLLKHNNMLIEYVRVFKSLLYDRSKCSLYIWCSPVWSTSNLRAGTAFIIEISCTSKVLKMFLKNDRIIVKTGPAWCPKPNPMVQLHYIL